MSPRKIKFRWSSFKWWKKLLMMLGVFVFGPIGFILSIIVIIFPPKIDFASVLNSISSGKSALAAAIEGVQSTADDIKANQSLDCSDLSPSKWVGDDNLIAKDQYILLSDSKKVGSIRFYKTFRDTFELSITFKPEALNGINTTISVRDDADNELAVTVGDDDYNSYRLVIKNNGTVILNDSLQPNGPDIKKDADVIFNLETTKRAEDLSASAYVVYTPSSKPAKPVTLDVFQRTIPYFLGNSVHLNIGVARTLSVTDPKIRIVECHINPKNF